MILRQQDFKNVTNHASRGQEVRDEARVRDRAPQTARSAPYTYVYRYMEINPTWNGDMSTMRVLNTWPLKG